MLANTLEHIKLPSVRLSNKKTYFRME